MPPCAVGEMGPGSSRHSLLAQAAPLARDDTAGDDMMTKLMISTLAAAIALGSVSSTFAAPKQKAQQQKVQEPIYSTLATGENF